MDYVNPFGSYAQGYGQGIQQENTLQQDTRKARDDDWTHNYLDPIKLDNAKLDNRYNHFALPYQEDGLNSSSQLLHSRVTDAQLATGANVATATGDTNPLNYAGHAADPMYVNQSHESLAERSDFGHNLQLDQANTNAGFREAQAQYYGDRGTAGLENANTRANARPGNAPVVGSTSMFGGAASTPAPTSAPQVPGYDPAQHGAGTQAWMQQYHQPNYSTLDPVSQGHMIYGLSQSTGMPMETAHGVLSSTPYQPPAQQPSASDYYTTDQ
jgi:hypothetical protein